MQKLQKVISFVTLTVVLLLFVSYSKVNAVEEINATNQGVNVVSTSNKTVLNRETAATQRASSASELRMAACEVHRKVINLRQNNIVEHTQKIQTRLEKLVTAVEKFYTDKLVPQGKTATNYDVLAANVNTKSTSLTAALNKIKADTDGLTCEKDQAKGQFVTFRTDMQSLIKAVKDYRLSVIQLMQAVKKVAGTTESGQATSSAKEVAK